jgi:hypothetical protein
MSATATTPGLKGFDTNTALRANTARSFYERGYSFALRYVPRVIHHDNDITSEEVGIIRAAGLGLMIVQHVEPNAWTPTSEKGTAYGEMAASSCAVIGYPPGCTVWLDLEGVAANVPASDVIAYGNRWHDTVRAHGYQPGIYVGWHCGLTPDQLYWRLKFRAYWSAYNLDANEFPRVRGVQMRQREVRSGDVPLGVGIAFDVNLVTGDALGGFPVMDR